jgi:hypothetical protein
VNSELSVAAWSHEMAHEVVEEMLARRWADDVLEYRVARGPAGEVLRADDGSIIPVFGPRNHCPPGLLNELEGMRVSLLAAELFVDFHTHLGGRQ